MSKRLIVPVKATLTVAGNIGTLVVPNFAGHLRYIVVEGPNANARGRVRVRDQDSGQDVYRDPRKVPTKVDLEFYHQAMAIPLNGIYEIIIDQADNGDYNIYYVLEERGNRV